MLVCIHNVIYTKHALLVDVKIYSVVALLSKPMHNVNAHEGEPAINPLIMNNSVGIKSNEMGMMYCTRPNCTPRGGKERSMKSSKWDQSLVSFK